MSIQTSSWRIQHTATSASLVRSCVMVGILTAALCTTFIVSGQYNDYVIFLKLAVLFSIFLPAVFIKKYFNYKKSEHFVILDSQSLTIPTPMLGNRTISLSNIKSFETLRSANKTRGILIGLSNGSSAFINAKTFQSQALFDDFTQRLTGRASQESTSAENSSTRLRVQFLKQDSTAALLVAAIILVVYLITNSSGVGDISAKAAEIGALTKSSSQFRNFYRIGSSFFLHGNFNHFFLNVLCLILTGGTIQTILGKLRFTSILFGSALAGSLFSLALAEHEAVIGASGGIMGLLGAYSVICLRYQNCIPGSTSSPARKIIAVLLIQIVFDMTNERIDSFSHTGGFLFGAIYAFFLLRGQQPNRFSVPSSGEAIGAAAIGSLYLIALAYFLFTYITLSISR